MKHRRYSKAQLNAISRSYTQKRQKEALEYLRLMGIDYDQYCKETGWKGGPVKLAQRYERQAEKLNNQNLC